MKSKAWRLAIMSLVLLATLAVFTYFVSNHPELRHQLRRISPGMLLLLFGLYAIQLSIVGLTVLYTMSLCGIKLPVRESLLLSMYTVVLNFFVPLQSGPAFRGLYVKRKYGLKLKNFTLATMVYLGLYAVFSGLFLVSPWLKWWLPFGILVALSGLIWYRYLPDKLTKRLSQLHWPSLWALAAVSFLQVASMSAIYYTELRMVSPGVHLSQAVIYTGAANFALFVALTPGAIGFREAFLLFSRHLHHIGTTTIVAANLIDRSVYIVILGLLVIFIFASHARDQFRPKPVKK